jgi:hypothetical protein
MYEYPDIPDGIDPTCIILLAFLVSFIVMLYPSIRRWIDQIGYERMRIKVAAEMEEMRRTYKWGEYEEFEDEPEADHNSSSSAE